MCYPLIIRFIWSFIGDCNLWTVSLASDEFAVRFVMAKLEAFDIQKCVWFAINALVTVYVIKPTQNVYLQPYELCIFAEDVRWQVLQLVVLQIPKKFFWVTNEESWQS